MSGGIRMEIGNERAIERAAYACGTEAFLIAEGAGHSDCQRRIRRGRRGHRTVVEHGAVEMATGIGHVQAPGRAVQEDSQRRVGRGVREMRKLTFEQLQRMSETELADWRAGGYEPVEDVIASILTNTDRYINPRPRDERLTS